MLLKKSISEDSDATPINDPDRDNLPDFSRVTRESTGQLGVSNVCVKPSVSHFSCGCGVLPERRKPRETACRQRERIEQQVIVEVSQVSEH